MLAAVAAARGVAAAVRQGALVAPARCAAATFPISRFDKDVEVPFEKLSKTLSIVNKRCVRAWWRSHRLCALIACALHAAG
jgi:hypothetical protein